MVLKKNHDGLRASGLVAGLAYSNVEANAVLLPKTPADRLGSQDLQNSNLAPGRLQNQGGNRLGSLRSAMLYLQPHQQTKQHNRITNKSIESSLKLS